MAIFRNFTGFESGHLLVLGQFSLNNGDGFLSVVEPGRSGRYGLRFNQTGVSASGHSVQFPAPGLAAFPADNEAGGIFRFFIKLASYPSADKVLGGWAGIAGAAHARLIVTSTGTFKAQTTGVTSAASLTVIPLGQWVEVQIGCFIHNDSSASAFDDYVKGTVTILGETLTQCVDGPGGFTDPAFALQRVLFGDLAANAVTIDVMYDDGFYVADTQAGPGACVPAGTCSCLRAMSDISTVTLPAETNIVPASPTAQGSLAQWTGGFALVTEIPFDPTNGASEQTDAVIEDATTFLHATAEALGISSIQGVRVLAEWKAALAVNHAILWDGVEYSVAVKAAYLTLPQPSQVIFGALTNAAFNAIEFGVRNKTGAAMQLGAILVEVLALGAGRLGTTPTPLAGGGGNGAPGGRWLMVSGPVAASGVTASPAQKWIPLGGAVPAAGSSPIVPQRWMPFFGSS